MNLALEPGQSITFMNKIFKKHKKSGLLNRSRVFLMVKRKPEADLARLNWITVIPVFSG